MTLKKCILDTRKSESDVGEITGRNFTLSENTRSKPENTLSSDG